MICKINLKIKDLSFFVGNMPDSVLPNNECSEQNESIGNVSESEEENTDNNQIENSANYTSSSFIKPNPQQWTSNTKSSSFQKKQRTTGLDEVNKAALDFFSKKRSQIIL